MRLTSYLLMLPEGPANLGVGKNVEDTKGDLGRCTPVDGRAAARGIRRGDSGATLEGELGRRLVDANRHRVVRPPHELVSERRRRAEEGLLIGAARREPGKGTCTLGAKSAAQRAQADLLAERRVPVIWPVLSRTVSISTE